MCRITKTWRVIELKRTMYECKTSAATHGCNSAPTANGIVHAVTVCEKVGSVVRCEVKKFRRENIVPSPMKLSAYFEVHHEP